MHCCHDPQNALVEEGYPCAAMQARCCCDSQNALVQGKCYPALSCKLCCLITECSWKKGVLSRCHASSCCCDSQNALGGRVLSLRCHASKLLS
jgi:hypothetical protein